MNALLENHFSRLQTNTRLLLKEVSSLSSSTYHAKPAEGKWSISQILTHLVTSERLSLLYMKRKSLGVDNLKDSGWVEKVKFFLLRVSQRMPIRYKAPKAVTGQTPSPLSYGDLVRQWEGVRHELLDFLEKIEDKNINRKIFKHPVAGMLDVVHAIQFMDEHLQHHLPQIRRIMVQQKRNKFERT